MIFQVIPNDGLLSFDDISSYTKRWFVKLWRYFEACRMKVCLSRALNVVQFILVKDPSFTEIFVDQTACHPSVLTKTFALILYLQPGITHWMKQHIWPAVFWSMYFAHTFRHQKIRWTWIPPFLLQRADQSGKKFDTHNNKYSQKRTSLFHVHINLCHLRIRVYSFSHNYYAVPIRCRGKIPLTKISPNLKSDGLSLWSKNTTNKPLFLVFSSRKIGQLILCEC